MLINCHTHTNRSHDSAAQPSVLCESAISHGLAGLLFTDHCDCEYADTVDYFELFGKCRADFEEVRTVYGDRLELLFGIELGDPLFNPDFARKITEAFRFDAVLLSVHAVRFPGYTFPFSAIDFSGFDDALINAYLFRYFTDLLESVKTFDFDILCHLTVPLRYIILKYNKTVDISLFDNLIDAILLELIRRDKTLEINTSAIDLPGGFFMPDTDIIKRFLSLGGKALCIGSDAHTPQAVAAGFTRCEAFLREINIKNLCRYKNRQRLYYPLQSSD